MKKEKIYSLIEAILFACGNSISIEKLADVIGISPKEVKNAIKAMKKQYEEEDRGIEIIELENSIQLGTKAVAYDYLLKMGKTAPKYVLTDSVLETLSIIAYKQPVTRGEIEKIRGVSCDHAINKLVEFELIEEVGRLDAPGRPLLFGTTEQFLRSFGVTSINDLPELSQEMYEDFKEQASKEALEENAGSEIVDDNEDVIVGI